MLVVLAVFGTLAACGAAGTHAVTAYPVAANPASVHGGSATIFRPRFGTSGLVTNEYAYRHPNLEDPALGEL